MALACQACGAQHRAELPAISATQFNGNARVPYLYRVTVTPEAIVRQRIGHAGGWQTVSRTPLTRSMRAQLESAAAAIDLSAMRADNVACHGLPLGDVGGVVLRVGSHTSNCAPPSAQRLLNLLSPYLG